MVTSWEVKVMGKMPQQVPVHWEGRAPVGELPWLGWGEAQWLVLAQYSGVTSGSAQGSHSGCRLQSQVPSPLALRDKDSRKPKANFGSMMNGNDSIQLTPQKISL